MPSPPAWSEKEEERLTALFIAGKNDAQIAEIMGRGIDAIHKHRSKLGLRHTDAKWPPIQVEMLRRLVDEGFAAKEIAERMTRAGHPQTRNGVMGKIARLKLHLKRSPNGAPKRKPKVSKPSPITSHLFSGSRFWKANDKPQRAKPRPQAIPQCKPLPLLNLGFGQCRYPVMEKPGVVGRYLFCAAPVAREGCSWCEAHAGVAWAESKSRAA